MESIFQFDKISFQKTFSFLQLLWIFDKSREFPVLRVMLKASIYHESSILFPILENTLVMFIFTFLPDDFHALTKFLQFFITVFNYTFVEIITCIIFWKLLFLLYLIGKPILLNNHIVLLSRSNEARKDIELLVVGAVKTMQILSVGHMRLLII